MLLRDLEDFRSALLGQGLVIFDLQHFYLRLALGLGNDFKVSIVEGLELTIDLVSKPLALLRSHLLLLALLKGGFLSLKRDKANYDLLIFSFPQILCTLMPRIRLDWQRFV